MSLHRVKTWRSYFADIRSGLKSFDLRRDARKYQVGDVVVFCEWDEKRKAYTGEETSKRICYKIEGVGIGAIAPLAGLSHGYCILGLAAPLDANLRHGPAVAPRAAA
jgi:hypothetical protein